MCAEPGMTPIRKPSRLPRPIGPTESRKSSREGMSSRNLGFWTLGGSSCPAVSRISDTPNKPTATGTMLMPSPSSTRPYVNRVNPLIWSIPIMPSSSPNPAIESVFNIDPPLM